MPRIGTALAIAGLAVLGVTACGGDRSPSQTTTDPSSQARGNTGVEVNFTAPHACDILTVEMASTVLGVAAQRSDSGRSLDISRGGARFSSCGYYPEDLAVGDEHVSFTMDAPIDESGISWVESGFTGVSIADPTATPVTGYGDKAVWSQQLAQLVVMNDGLWLSFTVGAGLDFSTYTLEDAKRLADVVLPTI